MLNNQNFAKDKNNVWYKHYLLKEADIVSFQALDFYLDNGNSSYSKDKNHVWCGESLLKDADPISFLIRSALASPISKL